MLKTMTELTALIGSVQNIMEGDSFHRQQLAAEGRLLWETRVVLDRVPENQSVDRIGRPGSEVLIGINQHGQVLICMVWETRRDWYLLPTSSGAMALARVCCYWME